jgi:hypothetical protein
MNARTPKPRVTATMLTALRWRAQGLRLAGNVHAATYWALCKHGLLTRDGELTAAGRAAIGHQTGTAV